MIPTSVRLYNPRGQDRVATVSVEPATTPGTYLLRVGRGKHRDRLVAGSTYGPYQLEELQSSQEQLLVNLRGEGFLPAGLHALLGDLQNTSSYVRARAASRMGWRKDPETVGPLLQALTTAVDDTCCILDALGAIGAEQAIPTMREYATRKLLSRRRSAVEALRMLGDEEGLKTCRRLALERLPESLRALLTTLGEDNHSDANIDKIIQSLDVLTLNNPVEAGLALDTLYELATPLPVAVIRKLLPKLAYDRPNVWRYVKSMLKRSLLRHDYRTFGIVSHAIERQGRLTTGSTATVKSGYDGQTRSSSIFRQKTQLYLRRLVWRYLRRLAQHRPESYPYAAAEAIIHYSSLDATPAQDLLGPYATCYTLCRVIYGKSARFALDNRRLEYRFRNQKALRALPSAREHAFPELWEAQPRAYLRVLGAAQVPEAHVFAVQALSVPRNREAVVMTASHEEILALLQAPYDPTVQLGLEELDRRLDPQRPDWDLVTKVLGDQRPIVLETAHRWLTILAPLWTADADRLVQMLLIVQPTLREKAVSLARVGVELSAELRQKVARSTITILQQPESAPGSHEAIGHLAEQSLLAELNSLLSVAEIVSWILNGSLAAQSVAGKLLGQRADTLSSLGLEGILSLAGHEVQSIRAAVHVLLRGALELLQEDPSPLFVLLESDWEDNRQVAFELLQREIASDKLGLDNIVAILDSNRLDVRQLGCELVERYLKELPVETLIYRLAENPHPSLRRFTVGLIVHELAPGSEPLQKISSFFRAAILELNPDRKLKNDILHFLQHRSLQDAEQAATLLPLLRDLARLHSRQDAEPALEVLVRIQLAFPELECGIKLKEDCLA